MTGLRMSGDCVIVIAWAAQFSSSRVSTGRWAAHDEMLAALPTEARAGAGGGGGVEWWIQFEGLSAECILVVAVAGECTAVHPACCRAGQRSLHAPWLLQARPGRKMYRRAGLCWLAFISRLQWLQSLLPSSPAVLCVLAPLPRLAAALCPATADSLQFRPETAAAGSRATGLLQALGGWYCQWLSSSLYWIVPWSTWCCSVSEPQGHAAH